MAIAATSVFDPMRKSTLPIYFNLRDLPLIEHKRRFAKLLGRAKRRSWCWRCRRLPAPTRGLSCVALFGIGSMSGMDALSMVTAVPLAVFARRLI